MFGQQNNKHHDDNKIPDKSIDGALEDTKPSSDQSNPTQSWQHPGQPLDDNSTQGNQTSAEVIAPDSAEPKTPPIPASSIHTATPETSAATSSAHDLIDIKQQALSQLSPLVGHLEQSPEDKFRTTMMMIQASDDQSLIQQAYDAAQQIQDEKIKAQALLDIVNEINYFTQHNNQ